MNSVSIPSQELNLLWGTRLEAVRLDAHVAGAKFDLFWTSEAQDTYASLIFTGIRYSRFEFDEFEVHEVVELVSIEAESCALGIRLFGELSNGTFEFVCANFRVEQRGSIGVA